MCGWIIFLLGLSSVALGALGQQPWVVPVVAIIWWIAQYVNVKREKEKLLILNRVKVLTENRSVA